MATIAFDIDGTLLVPATDSPNYHVIDLLRWFLYHNHTVYIWSGGGIDYARHQAERLGFNCPVIAKDPLVAHALGIEITVDDQPITLGKVNIQV